MKDREDEGAGFFDIKRRRIAHCWSARKHIIFLKVCILFTAELICSPVTVILVHVTQGQFLTGILNRTG